MSRSGGTFKAGTAQKTIIPWVITAFFFFFYLCVFAVAPLIGRYCGTKIPPEIQSPSGLLSLSFHTDMAVAKDGFSARYNLTRKEVSDCKCETAREGISALCVGLLAFSVLFQVYF